MIYFNYIITNKINKKRYVGAHSTNNINDGYLGGGLLIGRAIKKYGKENFTRDVLNRTTTKEEAFHNEKFLIEMYNTLVPNGYNISPTGGLGVSGSCIGELNGMYEKHHSEETKEKMRKPKSKEHKQKLSEAHMGKESPTRGKTRIYNEELDDQKTVKEEDLQRYLKIGYKLGTRPFSEETIQKMSESHEGEKNGMYGRSVYSVWLEKYGKEIADNKYNQMIEKRNNTRANNKRKKDE